MLGTGYKPSSSTMRDTAKGWTVSGRELSATQVAGADLTSKLGRRYHAAKDPRYASAPSFSFGRKLNSELNTLASNSPLYAKTGTHRVAQGETLLGSGSCLRNDKVLGKWTDEGRIWKSGSPGPGTYAIPRAFGTHMMNPKREVAVSVVQYGDRSPTWRFGGDPSKPTGPLRQRIYHTLGGGGHDSNRGTSEGGRYPTPRSLSPGPGRYFQDCDGAPSTFADYSRPQGRS
eukprot:TRINITY_DN50741_c0_g1_i1.p1 TRINITY_DN50741_c0_g1~~TRINITY_DN50741_c0_g1_i1.p1  ORF type:complete len:230 (-),score=17.74 TRINITY_DN50741_c0_g1_i1:105-794(-)